MNFTQLEKSGVFESSTPYLDRFAREEIEQSIVSRFEKQVAQYSDRLAIKRGSQTLTYETLNQLANQVGRAVLLRCDRKSGSESGSASALQPEPIVIVLEQGQAFITALLGVLKSGNFYIPIDPAFPAKRNAYIAENSQTKLIITCAEHLAIAQKLAPPGCEILELDKLPPNLSTENLDLPISPDSLANIIYTSGSTGKPKGVVQNHRNLLHNCRNYTHPMQISECDRLTLLHSCSVMGAVNGIFNALLNGAALYPFDIKKEGLANLAHWLLEEKITIYYSVVTLFRHFADFLATTKQYQTCQFEHLRLIRLGGEAVSPHDLACYQKQFSDHCLLYIGLGSTETGAINLFIADKKTEIDEGKLPLGDSVDDMRILLLDDHNQEVSQGDVGEICVQSPYLALEYWQNPERTQTAFMPDPAGGEKRIYRTGDLGQYLPNGRLVHQGRKDFQVKIRGYRVEIGEIETAIRNLDAVKEASVIGHQETTGATGTMQLIAYVVPADSVSNTQETFRVNFITAIRTQLQSHLPDYMVPAGFVLLKALPLTPNGKIDRRALPQPKAADWQISAPYVPPRTPLEKELSTLWKTVLKVEQVGIDDNFFELGGHSLLATQVISRIQTLYQLPLSLAALFETPTIAELAATIEQANSGVAQHASEQPRVIFTPIPQRQTVEATPLSFAQQRLWLLQQLDPKSPAYHMTRVLTLHGPLNVKALHQAFTTVLKRHEALRTRFITTEGTKGTKGTEGIPRQIISPGCSFDLSFIDLIDHSAAQQPEALKSLIESGASCPFDLTADLLLRATLIRLQAEKHVLQIVMHHIASDGWSIGVLMRELGELYQAYITEQTHSLLDLPIQYADFAEWQRQWLSDDVLASQLSYWKAQLAGAPPLLELPSDYVRSPQPSYQGSRLPFTISPSVTEGLKALSQQNGTTLFMTLLCAFNILLHRYSQQDTIVVGSPIANRNRPELEEMIGFFANTLALRTEFAGHPSFREVLKQVRQVALDAYAHQDLPFEKLVEELQPVRNLSYSPIFQVMFALQNVPEQSQQLGDLRIQTQSVDHTSAKFDLTLAMREQAHALKASELSVSELSGTLEYSTDLFERATIERMVSHFQVLLAAIVKDPNASVATLPMLSDTEREQVLVGWNQTTREYPRECCLHELFERQVVRSPDAIAIVFEHQSLTYAALNARANQLAHYLQTLGVGPESLVGIALDRSLEMLVGLLGILKAGGSYVPLDPSYPQARLDYMVEHSQLSVLLTQPEHVAVFATQSVRVVDIDGDWGAIAQYSPENPTSQVTAKNLAYTIYTSGSTGKPKGVQIEHRAVVNFLHAMQVQPGLTEQDSLVAVTTISFDIAVLELYLPLLVGARVVLASRDVATDANQLSTLLTDAGATVMQATPATWQMLLAGGWKGEPGLKMLCGGEKISRELADQLLVRGQELWNMYGPTEATVWAAASKVLPGTEAVPVAGPLANTQIYVLETSPAGAVSPLPIGIPGEVHIGGDCLARGYLHRPDLTQARFISDPFSHQPNARLYKTGDLARFRPDGTLEFLGRMDHQVKVRGFRIELGEIETALGQHPAVRQAIVVVREDSVGDKRLVAYWVAIAANEQPNTGEFRQCLKQSLPDYMIPSAFVCLDRLPLTPNGKVDRLALPQPETIEIQSTAEIVAPRNPLETQLSHIWADVLKLKQIGIHDNFFELGGHSLLAAQIVARFQATGAINMPLALLFEFPTIAELAASLQSVTPDLATSQLGTGLPPITRLSRPSGTASLSFAQQRLWLLHQIDPENNSYHMTRTLRLYGPLNVKALTQAFTTILERHEALRTHFMVVDGVPQQVISPPCLFDLPLIDFSAHSPESLPAALSARLEKAAYRLFDLTSDLMLRATLIRLGPEEHVLQFVMHHIAADGWSRSLLMQELNALYQAYVTGNPNPLPDLSVQYADFAEEQRQWLSGKVLASQLGYWETQLASAPPSLALPTDRPRPLQPSYQGERMTFTVPPAIAQKLNALSQKNGATLFMTLLSVFNILLYRYSGQTDIMVGSPIANRPQKALEPLIGLFLNTLVLRTNLAGEPSFRELLNRVRQMALDAYAHQDLPFEQLLETLKPERDLGVSPWFQVMFVLQNTPQVEPDLTGLNIQPEPIRKNTAKFDITLSMSERAGALKGVLECSIDLFDTATMERMVGHFQTLLEAVVTNPNDLISTLPLLTTTEREQLLLKATSSQPDYPQAGYLQADYPQVDYPQADYPQNQCIHQLFEAQAKQTPDAIAVVFQDQQLTYRALDERANQLAGWLRHLGVGPDVLVGLCVNRSIEMMVGLLGILKAGGAYVPLDPNYPKERLAMMVTDAHPRVVVTLQAVQAALPDLDIPVVCLDRDWNEMIQQAVGQGIELESDVQPHHLAYVIYTSGSTGRPKGVMIEHRALVNFAIAAITQYPISKRDRVLQFASINFDAAAEEIFPALCCGATLVLRTDEMISSPRHFMQQCQALNLTVLDLPTAYWHQLTAAFSTTHYPLPPALRLVIIGGETALPEQLRNWQRWLKVSRMRVNEADLPSSFEQKENCHQLPTHQRPTLINTYGPTETTVVATCHHISALADDLADVPIGQGLSNVQTYLLDTHLQPVPTGVGGELYIGGSGLARGYLNHDDLTQACFIPHPFSDEPHARLYKTGDLACALPDGTLKFLGRRDDQVKIRGFRIELGDVETALGQHPDVQQCVVIAREDIPGDKRLVSYVVAAEKTNHGNTNHDNTIHDNTTIAISELRQFLQQRLPGYMVPSAFVLLAALPLTPSNKVDRHALPKPEAADLPAAELYVAPRNEVEQQLADIWADVLKLDHVGIYDNFFALGGHSLLAIQAIARIQTVCQIHVSLASLFETPTIAGLATSIEQTKGENTPAVSTTAIAPIRRRIDPNAALPLSFAQQRIWFLQQLEPSSSAYHMLRIWRLRGPLNREALQQALTAILARHEILRTRFVTTDGIPQQRITPASLFELPFIDLSTDPIAGRASAPNQSFAGDLTERALTELLEKGARCPFDLSTENMLRASLVRISENEHVLQMVIHHIASDGWSMGVLTQELSTLYQAYVTGQANPLAELPVQYADFSEWQRQWLSGDVLSSQLNYWEHQLADAPPLLALPTDYPRPLQPTYRGAQMTFTLPQFLTKRLKTLSQENGATLFMTLLSAFNTLLYRYSGQTDIMVGSPIANRPHKELEPLIGLFLNTLVLRTNLAENPTFRELLSRVKQTALDAYAHQDVPFEQLLETLKPARDLSHSPWFQVLFVLQNTPPVSQQLANLSIQTEHVRKTTAKFDLTLSLSEQPDGLKGTLEYSTELFQAATIERMVGHFKTLLEAVVTHPDTSIATLPMLTEMERQQLLKGALGETQRPINTPQAQCIHQLFEAQVARNPNALAVVFNGQQLTYGDLNVRANRLARYLQALGVGPDVLVGICIHRSLEMMVGLLGILKAGGAYVPLDPTYPQDRLEMMVADAQPQVLLTVKTLQMVLPALGMPVVCLDSDWHEISQCTAEWLLSDVQVNNLAYVIYTSGSTGKPKGVMIEHRALVNFAIAAIDTYGLSPRDRILQFASINFDAAVEEIFPALCCGATIVLRTEEMISSATYFMQQCDVLGLTVLDLPTAYWHQLTAELCTADCPLPPALRLVIIGGEAALPDQLSHWQRWVQSSAIAPTKSSQLPTVVNTYGPTEATVVATCHHIPAVRDTYDALDIPIGYPLANTQIYLLDSYLQPVPIGISGEIYIGGNSLARGYLNRADLTQSRFISHPFSEDANARLYKTGDLACYLPDGHLKFLGRCDDQVKIRGFRIELGEVETALSQHPCVQHCTVIAREDNPGDKRLVGYVVSSATETIHSLSLRQFLQQKLPGYMVPSAFVQLSALPLTPSNKIDRRALPKPNTADLRDWAPYVAPRNLLEEQLSHIWVAVLNLEQVGIHDNFFELGGHSLLSAQVVARVQSICGISMPLALLFEFPTIAELAKQMARLEGDTVASAMIPDEDSLLVLLKQGNPAEPPLFLIHDADGDVSLYGNLAAKLGRDRMIYAIKPRSALGVPMVYSRIEAIAADYCQQIQLVQPDGPYLLGGLCIGGRLAFEMALQLQAQGQEVALVAMLDSVGNGAKKRTDYKLANVRTRSRQAKVSTVLQALKHQGLAKNPLRFWHVIAMLAAKVAAKAMNRLSYETGQTITHWQTNLFRRFYDGQTQPLPRFFSGLSVRKILVFAVKDYSPRAKFEGQTLLIKASFGMREDEPAYAEVYEDPQFGWGRYVTQPLQVYQVTGGHNTMLGAEKIAEVEGIVSEAITKAL